MIEIMYPKTVENILDYDGIKAAAKKYVEDVFLEIVKSFGENLVLQTMDEEHLSIVTKNVAGTSMSIDDFLDYINTDNIYRECEFVSDLYTAFPEGVEYKEFDVTGHNFPTANFDPFNVVTRSYRNGNPRPDCVDEVWEDNAQNSPLNNLLMSRFGRQLDGEVWDWKKVSGRRASWGEKSTWMTTGGFGKPATIHINVDEERTILTENGLSSVENWLGTVSNKLPINLYIEINDELFTRDSSESVNGLAGSSDGYYMSFPYEEEETICTNDTSWEQEIYYTNKRYEGEGTLFIYVNYNRVTGESKVILADRYGNESRVPNIYVDKQILSDISGIPISDLDENFWQFMAESEDVEIYHQSIQIAELSEFGGYPIVNYYDGLEGRVDGEFVGFGIIGLNFVTPISNLDTDPHIFDEIYENWYSLERLGNSSGLIQFDSPDVSELALNKYIRRVEDLCDQKYKSHILDVTKTHIINGENGKPSVSIVDYLEQNEFGSTFIFTMPFNWFGARYAFDNKGNEWDVTREIEPEPEPPEPPVPPTPENKPDFVVLDIETGEVVHTADVGQVSYISFTQTYQINNIAHLNYIPFTQLFRVPDDSMRFIEESPVSVITGYFNSGPGNDQMPTDTPWGSDGGQIELLYFHNSDQRVPYDSSKSYIVKTVFYVGGAEVTDADLAPYTVSQYVRISDLNYMGNHTGTLILRTLTNNPIYGKPCGCTYEEEENPNYIEILFNLTGDGDANTFGFNDYWGSNIINNTDLQTLEDFGVNIDSSSSPNRVSSSNSNFTFTPIGLYGASGEDLGADMSNFYCAQGRGSLGACMCIWSINDYSTYVYKWKCRITKNS